MKIYVLNIRWESEGERDWVDFQETVSACDSKDRAENEVKRISKIISDFLDGGHKEEDEDYESVVNETNKSLGFHFFEDWVNYDEDVWTYRGINIVELELIK